MLQAGGSRVRFPMVSWEFSLTKSFRPYYGPGVDSASIINTRNISLEVKAAGAWVSYYHLRVPIVLTPESFNPLEPPRPLQACTGIVVPLPLPLPLPSYLCQDL